MKKTLKKYFIPHEGNNHKPHILRNKATFVIVGILVAMELFFLAGTGFYFDYRGYFARIISGVLVDETNSSRISQNLESLAVSSVLEVAAKEKAEDMARNSYFSHVGPDGKTPWEWLREAGYEYSYAGENLAVNFIDSHDVVNAWMNSPGHRANILNGKYTEIGIGTATGTYKGKETVFIAQYFGRPLSTVNSNLLPKINVAEASSSSGQVLEKEKKPATTSIAKVESTPIKNSVLGESLEVTPSSTVQEAIFVSIENPDRVMRDLPLASNAGSSIKEKQSSILEKAFASPKSIANQVLIFFGLMIALALSLKVFIKFEFQHPPLILNGVIMIILILSALMLNKYIGIVSAQIL